MLEAVGLGGKANSSTVSAPVSGASGEGSWRDSGADSVTHTVRCDRS